MMFDQFNTGHDMRTCCPSCSSAIFVKNGLNRHGDQNHRCLECGRQFVLDPQNKVISEETKDTVRKLLLEKLSLAGIYGCLILSNKNMRRPLEI